MNSLAITPEERQQYQQHFLTANPADGKLPGSVARANLLQSGLPHQQLGEIWELADIDKDGALDFDEYCIALKLVFSVLNHTIPAVPPVLPPSLIPESKYRYFGSAISPGVVSLGMQSMGLAAGQTGSYGLSPNTTLEWYVPNEDRARYESLFAQHARGSQVRLLDVDELLNSLGVPRPAVTQAWGLVDVRKYQQLNKDQFVYLLHVLSSCTRGVRIPDALPAAVKDNIYRSLDLGANIEGPTSHQYGKPASTSQSSRTPGLYGEKSTNVALADSYLSKLKTSSTFKNEAGSRYASSSKNVEEEKRLRAELEDLDAELRLLEQQDEPRDQSLLDETLSELESLRDHKKGEKKLAEQQGSANDGESLQEIKQSIFNLEGHLSFLLSEKRAMDSFIESSKQELLDLQMEQVKLK
ncbi:cytoskeletal-regulatory complex EF hand-domain-containing protein [Coemansia spiralis]|nr:cytoskeletal-regulatory complex EF hand-domain-containing protein [Coemansia spiralis]